MDRTEVLVIGGGATGAGTARDLAMRGFQVTLLERSDFSCGATGRSHGMLHSGARYAVKDPQSAVECATEGEVLRRIAPFCVEDTGGLFVGLTQEDEDYLPTFLRACQASGVRTREIGVEEALEREPVLNPGTKAAVEVNDGYLDPFFLTQGNVRDARSWGARVLNYAEVVDMRISGGRIEEVDYRDLRTGGIETTRPEMVVNATGAWADRIAGMAGMSISLRVDKGSLVVMNGRMTRALINRLRPPSDGDIIVPSHSSSIVGTTSVAIDDPDECHPTREEVDLLISQGADMVPALKGARAIRAYAGIRPLPAESEEGREISRAYHLLDHEEEGLDNLVSIIGGKLTTYRLMAEEVSDLVAAKLGGRGGCRTALEPIMEGATEISSPLPEFHLSRMRRKYRGLAPSIAKECEEPRGRETLCSCERVLRGEAQFFCREGDVHLMSDLLRRTRAGMGFCQSGMCWSRLLSVMIDHLDRDPEELLREYLRERMRGVRPVLFGEQLRQEAFKEYLSTLYHLPGGEP
ncbi:MAG: anaerobic glycerol-3-phosphate dehydrogenase subunit GlpA [Methanomassiliicoccales archaeon]